MQFALGIGIYIAGVVVMTMVMIWEAWRPVGWEEKAIGRREPELGGVLMAIVSWPFLIIIVVVGGIVMAGRDLLYGFGWIITRPLISLFQSDDPFVGTHSMLGGMIYERNWALKCQVASIRLVWSRLRGKPCNC